MSASSQIPGNEASKGRLSYRGSYNLEDMNTYANGKKTFQTYTKKSSWDSAQKSCLAQPGGVWIHRIEVLLCESKMRRLSLNYLLK